MKKWQKFSEEELREIFENSKTATEFAEKIGYKNRSITRDIKQTYPWCDFRERDCNLTGKRFGKLTVIEFESVIDQKKCWKCQCDCGNIVHNVRSGNLKSGNTKSCGCLIKDTLSEKVKEWHGESLVGKTFGYLTVLSETKEIKGLMKIKCLCKCGNITYVTKNKLISGNTKSCGCLAKERASQSNSIDMTGQIFGKLTVLEPTNQRKHRHIIWKCQCECGNIVYVKGANLRNGTTQSCGCARGYLTAQTIGSILKDMNIDYQKEYSFDDLKGDDKVLRFDFGIFKNNKLICLIEYQGKQHYEIIDYFGGEEEFEKRQKYDVKKREYCNKNNIPLIEISYLDKDKLSAQYLYELFKKYNIDIDYN